MVVERDGLDVKQLSRVFKALSNPNRLQIYLEVLSHRQSGIAAPEAGCGIADLIGKLSVGAPTISHHVKELVDAGLVTVEKNGKFVTCHLNEEMQKHLNLFFG
ncbi:MAG: helix-turn-helix transcriptional regulator [Oleispira sp.]|nr:helix-turn-helix transcriptional regulator [Oleispira sp.]MBL4880244.1 helix-turn-helix transcriptional regulator [Oleispira sp.]